MTMILEFFELVGAILTGLLGLLTQSLEGIVLVFYASPNGTDPAEFTFLGILLLFGLGMLFLTFGWRVVQGFIRK